MNRGQRRSNWVTSHRQALHSLRRGGVRLEIRELVLHSFPPTSRYSIAESTKTQLTNLLNEQGVPSIFKTTSDRALVDAGSFSLPSDARPQAIGTLVARAIYGGTK